MCKIVRQLMDIGGGRVNDLRLDGGCEGVRHCVGGCVGRGGAQGEGVSSVVWTGARVRRRQTALQS